MTVPFGLPQRRKLPPQLPEVALLLAERFDRAASAHESWAKEAKTAVEFFESKQWEDEIKAAIEAQGRPALTLNKIKPLVKMVIGYFITNQTDTKFNPGNDGSGTADVASCLTQVWKQIAELSQLEYVDTDVFCDGIMTGRGYWDARLDFESNDLGELRWTAQDPFATYLDPDGDQYDLNASNFVINSRWLSIDEVDFYYGPEASALARPLVGSSQWLGVPGSITDQVNEITPARRFGLEDDVVGMHAFQERFYEYVDTQRKTLRLIDMQHYKLTQRWFFLDLETGDRAPVPDHWSPDKVRVALEWANAQGDPLRVEKRISRRVRWTQMVGDVIVYDDWSPYKTFSIIPFFPYFRRGKTKGMITDLIDPQKEINKRRSARLNIVGRAAAGGWMYPKGSLDVINKENLERYGSAPGVMVEYDPKSVPNGVAKPEQIAPATPPLAFAQLEIEAEDDLKEISGINESALGNLDRVQSGRAIEARQRQAIMGMELDLQNYNRSKELQGRKGLEIIQDFYTEQRVIRVKGPTGNPLVTIINQRTAAGVINNVTLGKYSVSIDTSPLSATFLEAQFEEVIRMKEAGVPIPDDVLIDASSLGRKDEIKARFNLLRQQMMMGNPNAHLAAGFSVPPEALAGPPVPTGPDPAMAGVPTAPVPAAAPPQQ